MPHRYSERAAALLLWSGVLVGDALALRIADTLNVCHSERSGTILQGWCRVVRNPYSLPGSSGQKRSLVD